MTIRNWGPVRDSMRTDVAEVDGRIDVISALKLIEKGRCDQPHWQATGRER